MKKKFSLLIVLLVWVNLAGEILSVRPKSFYLFMDTKVIRHSDVTYDQRGNATSLATFDGDEKPVSREEYRYDSENNVDEITFFDANNMYLKTRKVLYAPGGKPSLSIDKKKDGGLIEYCASRYSEGNLTRVDCFDPGHVLIRYAEYNYSEKRLSTIIFNETGKYTMSVRCVYDASGRLMRQEIRHSSAGPIFDRRIIYEKGIINANVKDIFFQ